MKSKLLHTAPERTFAVVFDEGDKLPEQLLAFVREQNLAASQITGIGAFSSAVLGYFDPQTKEYEKIPIKEQVEVLSFIGNVAQLGEEHRIHIHIVVGKRDGTALGGHLIEAPRSAHPGAHCHRIPRSLAAPYGRKIWTAFDRDLAGAEPRQRSKKDRQRELCGQQGEDRAGRIAACGRMQVQQEICVTSVKAASTRE